MGDHNSQKILDALDSEGTKNNLRKLFERFGEKYSKRYGEPSGRINYDPGTKTLEFEVKAAKEYKELDKYLRQMENGDYTEMGRLAQELQLRLSYYSLESRGKVWQKEAREVLIGLKNLASNSPAQGEGWVKSPKDELLSEESAQATNKDPKYLADWYRRKVIAFESASMKIGSERKTKYGYEDGQVNEPHCIGLFHCHPKSPRDHIGPSPADKAYSIDVSSPQLVICMEGDGAGIYHLFGGGVTHRHVRLYEFPVFSAREWLAEVNSGNYTHLNKLIAAAKKVERQIVTDSDKLHLQTGMVLGETDKEIREGGPGNAIVSSFEAIEKELLELKSNPIDSNGKVISDYEHLVIPLMEQLSFRDRENIKHVGKHPKGIP